MKKDHVLLRIVDRVFWGMASLKFAVFNIAAIAICCGTATIIEAVYDTPTAQYYIYRSTLFDLLLLSFGLNIFIVAVSRWPWKKHHAAFLLAHSGILMILIGSWITQQFGLDGSIRLEEGNQTNVVEIDQPTLIMIEGNTLDEINVPWTPPIAKFKPIHVAKYGLSVQDYMTHAEGKVEFANAEPGEEGEPAIHLQLDGGPMRIQQDFWLWAGDAAWATAQAGPAHLRIVAEGKPMNPAVAPGVAKAAGPSFTVSPNAKGEIVYVAQSSDGKVRTGRFAQAKAADTTIEPGWAGDMKIHVLEYLPRASAKTVYVPSREQFGMQTPSSAIHIVAGTGAKQANIWLGLGDRASLEYNGRQVGLAYFPKRFQLDFNLRLDRFQIDHYEGTLDPSEYSSLVSVVDPHASATDAPLKKQEISMNEPLVHSGITFYQASYEDGRPRPTVSIFTVNRDPGRKLKYGGSIMLVLGSALLFYQKLKKKGVPYKPHRRPDSEVSS